MEKEVCVRPIGVVMTCDKCTDGKLNYTEKTNFIRDDSHFYQHRCNNCNCVKWLSNKYPFIKYEFDNC